MSSHHTRYYHSSPSIKEVRYRRYGELYSSWFDRIFYACITAIFFVLIGAIIDASVTFLLSVFNVGNGKLTLIFTPILAVLGIILGFISGKNTENVLMDTLNITDNSPIQDISLAHYLFRGTGIAIFLFAIVWLFIMIKA